MKDLWKSGVLILLIIGTVYILYLRECKRPLPCPAEDEVIIKTSVWDSVQALANKLPEVRIDTIIIKGDIVYLPAEPLPPPTPEPKDSSINVYADSLVTKDIDVHYNFKVKGTLLDREWRYSPITTVIRIDSIIYVPKLVKVPVPVIQVKNSLFMYGVAGGNKSAFLFGGGLDFITKKETMIGYQFQRFGDINFHSVRLGAKIKWGND